MKIVFMGTPDFAIPSLKSLHASGHEIVAVVTKPDMMRDRGKKLKMPPVKEEALKMNLEVIQPTRVRGNEEFISQLRGLGAECIVVVAYGMILPKAIISMAPLGCINVHGSILPKFRGAAPIQRAIMEGEVETGISIMEVAEELDAGDVILQETTRIGKKDAGQLYDELSEIGGRLIVEAVDLLGSGKATKTPQDGGRVTYAQRISKEDEWIDFTQPAERIERQIRGLSPRPGAYSYMNGKVLKIWKASVASENLEDGVEGCCGNQPGRIIRVHDGVLEVGTGCGKLLIHEIQLEGKKRMTVKDYLKGNRIDGIIVLG